LRPSLALIGQFQNVVRFFSSSNRHSKRPPWRHQWCHRTKFTFRLIPGWEGSSTPILAWIRPFLNFLRFFQAKSEVIWLPWRHRRWRHIEPTTEQFQGRQETPTPSLVQIGQFMNFFTIF
jgi:hypothetical protein